MGTPSRHVDGAYGDAGGGSVEKDVVGAEEVLRLGIERMLSCRPGGGVRPVGFGSFGPKFRNSEVGEQSGEPTRKLQSNCHSSSSAHMQWLSSVSTVSFA
jgi:hypothetical protein